MSDEYIREKFKLAIDKLYREDFYLIQMKCSERSIVFILGVYLVQLFKNEGVDVDCEYNRNGFACKSLIGRKCNYPDIIVHKRGSNENNSLIIEVKTPSDIKQSEIENDCDKLIGFTREEPYCYSLGAHIFISSTECRIVWYLNSGIICNAFYVCERDKCLYPEDLSEVKNRCAFDKWYFDNFNVLVDHEGFKSR